MPETRTASAHWLNQERLRVYPWLFISMYILLGAGWVAFSADGVDPRGKPLGYDFIAFWSASQVAIEQGAVAAYDLTTIIRAQHELVPGILTVHPWHYPPTFFLVVLPLSLLPYAVSFFAFVGVTLAAYVHVVRRVLAGPGVMPLLFASPGLMLNLFHGQNAFLTAALMGGGLLLLDRRPWIAGLCFGLLTIKPHMGLLIPLALIAGRHFRCFISASLTTIAFLVLSVAILGSETLHAFFARVPEVSQWVSLNKLPLIKMPTLFATALRLEASPNVAYLLQALLALFAACATFWLWRSSAAPALKNAGLCAASLLVSPYLFDYDLAWLALPIAWFVAHAQVFGWLRGERNVLILTWLLPMLLLPFGIVLGLGIAPFVILALLLIILRRAHKDLVPASSYSKPTTFA